MILIVQSLWNESITEKLASSAQQTLENKGIQSETIQVPGALEIPLAILYASERADIEGFVACATVVKGDTYHFEVVANESARAIMDLQMQLGLPIANAILATYTIEQAIERAGGRHGNKGEEAATP